MAIFHKSSSWLAVKEVTDTVVYRPTDCIKLTRVQLFALEGCFGRGEEGRWSGELYELCIGLGRLQLTNRLSWLPSQPLPCVPCRGRNYGGIRGGQSSPHAHLVYKQNSSKILLYRCTVLQWTVIFFHIVLRYVFGRIDRPLWSSRNILRSDKIEKYLYEKRHEINKT